MLESSLGWNGAFAAWCHRQFRWRGFADDLRCPFLGVGLGLPLAVLPRSAEGKVVVPIAGNGLRSAEMRNESGACPREDVCRDPD